MEAKYSIRSRFGADGGSVKSRILATEGSTNNASPSFSKAKKAGPITDQRAFRNAEGVKSRMDKFKNFSNSPSSVGSPSQKDLKDELKMDTVTSSGMVTSLNRESSTRNGAFKQKEQNEDDVNNNTVLKTPIRKKLSSNTEHFTKNEAAAQKSETEIVSTGASENCALSDQEDLTNKKTRLDQKPDCVPERMSQSTFSALENESTNLQEKNKIIENTPQGDVKESKTKTGLITSKGDKQKDNGSRAEESPNQQNDEIPSTAHKKHEECTSAVTEVNVKINDPVSNEVIVSMAKSTDAGDLVSAFAVSKSVKSKHDQQDNEESLTPAFDVTEEKDVSAELDTPVRSRRQRRTNKVVASERDAPNSGTDVSTEKQAPDTLELEKSTVSTSEGTGNTGRRRRRVRKGQLDSKSSASSSVASTPDRDCKVPILESPDRCNSSFAVSIISTPDSSVNKPIISAPLSPSIDPICPSENESKEIPIEETQHHVTDDAASKQVEAGSEGISGNNDEKRDNNETDAKKSRSIKVRRIWSAPDDSLPFEPIIDEKQNKSEITEDSILEDKITDEAFATTISQDDKASEIENLSLENLTESPNEMRYTLDNLEECTEQSILERLLSEAEEYDDRKKIRAAIRALKKSQAGGITSTPKQTSDIKWQARTTTPARFGKNTNQTTKTNTTENKESKTPSTKWQSRITSPRDGTKASPDSKSLADKYSLSKSTKSEMTSGSKKIGSIFDREEEAPKKSSSRLDIERLQAERRKEITRNRSMPVTSSKDARKMFAKLDGDGSAAKGNKKVTKSPAFVVPNANNVKQMLLRWCQAKTRGYEHVNITNYSSSWGDGMAFCALVHNFFPTAFDYSKLDPKNREHNFDLAFKMAEKHGDIPPLLDVEDMVRMHEPDWKCIYTYITEFYKRIRDLGL